MHCIVCLCKQQQFVLTKQGITLVVVYYGHSVIYSFSFLFRSFKLEYTLSNNYKKKILTISTAKYFPSKYQVCIPRFSISIFNHNVEPYAYLSFENYSAAKFNMKVSSIDIF